MKGLWLKVVREGVESGFIGSYCMSDCTSIPSLNGSPFSHIPEQ